MKCRLLICTGILIAVLYLAHAGTAGAQATSTPTPTLVHPDGTSWHGYLIMEIAPVGPFVNGVNDTQKARLHEAFETLASSHGSWPPYLLQDSRWRLDNLAVLVEARFSTMPTKVQVVRLIANRTGYTVAQVNNALTFIVFAYGGSWNESRDDCAKYLAEHSAEWEGSTI